MGSRAGREWAEQRAEARHLELLAEHEPLARDWRSEFSAAYRGGLGRGRLCASDVLDH